MSFPFLSPILLQSMQYGGLNDNFSSILSQKIARDTDSQCSPDKIPFPYLCLWIKPIARESWSLVGIAGISVSARRPEYRRTNGSDACEACQYGDRRQLRSSERFANKYHEQKRGGRGWFNGKCQIYPPKEQRAVDNKQGVNVINLICEFPRNDSWQCLPHDWKIRAALATRCVRPQEMAKSKQTHKKWPRFNNLDGSKFFRTK